jgi:hypothetical protein
VSFDPSAPRAPAARRWQIHDAGAPEPFDNRRLSGSGDIARGLIKSWVVKARSEGSARNKLVRPKFSAMKLDTPDILRSHTMCAKLVSNRFAKQRVLRATGNVLHQAIAQKRSTPTWSPPRPRTREQTGQAPTFSPVRHHGLNVWPTRPVSGFPMARHQVFPWLSVGLPTPSIRFSCLDAIA